MKYPRICQALIVSFLLFGGSSVSQISKNVTLNEIKVAASKNCQYKNLTGDSEWTQFRRWEAFWEIRTFPSGEFPQPDALYKEQKRFAKAGKSSLATQADSGNWSFIGPDVVPSSGGGAGRLNCLTLDPSNPTTIWAGAACGGLWKSNNDGASWQIASTDLLPSLSISDIVIDPANSQNMYIATGDKYGIYYMLFTWGHYSAGVLHSTDGGQTWDTTGLNFSLDSNLLVQRLIMDPNNSQILFAATMSGVYKTADGGNTWALVQAGKFYDIEMKPGDGSILYAADSTKVYRSSDAGNSWINTGISAKGRSSIAVSNGFPNVVYVWGDGMVYYSNDAGVTFNFRADPSSASNPMGHYDKVLAVSPVDQNILLAGGVELAVSTDGGLSWTKMSSTPPSTNPDYIHADQKDFAFLPGSSSTIYIANDGGLFKTTDQCSTYTDLSNGLHIKQYYRMASSSQNPSTIFGGAQDNGTDKITGPGAATMVLWFDGMDCLVDYTDDNIVFASTQGGAFKRSTNGGASFSNVNATGCYWTSPIEMDPVNHDIIYIGSGYMRKSLDNGVTWNTLGVGDLDGKCLYSIDISKSNPNYVYTSNFAHLYVSPDGGINWTDITGSLPVNTAAISGVTVSENDPGKIWVSFSGFSQGNKVFYSPDTGASWINISNGLPNIPVNCIKYQYGTNDMVYAGTETGVYVKDTGNTWLPFSNGLPNVIIYDLEMYYPTGKIRAATFGRGIWESDFYDTTTVTTMVTDNYLTNLDFAVFPNPSSGLINISFQSNVRSEAEVEIYSLLGERIGKSAPFKSEIGSNLFSYHLPEHASNGAYIIMLNLNGQERSKFFVLNNP